MFRTALFDPSFFRFLSHGARLPSLRFRLAGAVLAFLMALLVGGCDEGTAPPVAGEIRGIVMIEGAALSDVTVELRGDAARDTRTDAGGRFVFEDVPAGAYVVSIRGQPVDASFSSTSRTAVIGREAGRRTVTLDFLGSFIRTSTIQGRVTARDRPLGNVLVRGLGPDTVEARSDEDGRYTFTGLRRGAYRMEVSGFPANVVFPVQEVAVEVETGETAVADFSGTVELSASLAISGLRRILPDGSTEPVNNLDFRGRVQVEVTVDRGEDTPEFVELLLGDEVLARQTFNPDGSPAAPMAATVEALGGGAPMPGAPLQLNFLVASDEFNAQTGAVRFRNGSTTLRARLATREGGADAWLSTIQINLTNRDTFVGGFSPARGPVAGSEGETWVGGDILARVVPVIYSQDRELASVVVDIRRAGGGPLATQMVEGAGPYRPLFGADGTGGLLDYQTPRGALDQLWVREATYVDGTPVSGLPRVLADSIRIDNRPPPPGVFQLPEQGVDGADCCLGNWVGASFRFPDAYQEAEDEGVGGGSVSIHAGPASLTDQELAQRPAVILGEQLNPTAGNTALRAVAVHRDALQNRRIVPLATSRGNTLGDGGRAVFGVDLAAPEARFSTDSPLDRALNPPAGARWSLRVEDEGSGFSAAPARSVVRRIAPGIDGEEACPFPATDLCAPAPDGLQRPVPANGAGYFRYETRVVDRAGNPSLPLTRWVLRDTETPEVEAVESPRQVTAGTPFSVAAPVRDNVDLRRARVEMVFGGADGGVRLAPVPSDTLGTPFGGTPRATATARWTLPGVVAVEGVRPSDGAPSGILLPLGRVLVEVEDAAGLMASGGTELRPAGGLPQGFGVEAREARAAVVQWSLSVEGEATVCVAPDPVRSGEGIPCPEDDRTLSLIATAKGDGDGFSPEFSQVVFFAQVGDRRFWLGQGEALEEVGESSSVRSWRLEWTPEAGFPIGERLRLRAFALDGAGAALLTAPLEGVSVEGPP